MKTFILITLLGLGIIPLSAPNLPIIDESYSCLGSTDDYTLSLYRGGVQYNVFSAPYGQEYDIVVDMSSSAGCGNNTAYRIVGSYNVSFSTSEVSSTSCGDAVFEDILILGTNWYVDIAPLPLGIGDMSYACLDDLQHIGTIF
ncbi:hypothetical protein EV198_0234 [Roseivirga ehrenbergii]|uniref:Uncharacterized protein n=2 Tax=Roseivirga TaxID=290180 RepID=A0A150X9F5_9BACT|nr:MULTISPECIES: hypothetical protein [Roseivirga]KYG72177.1 hypothetical protein MB14_09025 [Roseivirga ehrenbergii]KYG75369.1 hypothetical protein AWN68_07415 [Roseivirga echinicomitans]TCL13411.1 hypothetical protein EV198_0234 [Roseivirga ehrenbergii]